MLLTRHVDTLILDHHVLRSFEGYDWLKELAGKVESRILCAAEFMEKKHLNSLRLKEKPFMKKYLYL